MKTIHKALLLALALLCAGGKLRAQHAGPANLTAQGTNCGANAAQSLTAQISTVAPGSVVFDANGTFSATVSFFASQDPVATAIANSTWRALGVTKSDGSSASPVTSTTSNGSAWQANAGAYQSFCMMVTAYTSGTVAASINLSPASARAPGGGSGGVPALTDGATVTWNLAASTSASLTFTTHGGSRTLQVTNPAAGVYYGLKLVQDGTGGEGLNLGTDGCTWLVSGGGAGAITPSTGAGAVDFLSFMYDGEGNCLANFNANFS